jgi:protein-tyrosine-phosphatase
VEQQRVLFLCTGNTARSQMAEAFLRKYGGARFDVESAGLEPGEEIHPLARRVMEEEGIGMTGHHPKSLRPFLSRVWVDLVVFVCTRAEQNCPFLWPSTIRALPRRFHDPAAFEGGEEEKVQKFRAARDQIGERIKKWLTEPTECQGDHMTDPGNQGARRKRVLFVCVESANRSQMAEAFARIHGGDRIEAYSAGSRPSGKVNPRAVEFMKEVGYDLTTHQSKALADLPAGEFDVVVGMGCGDEGCPLVRAKRHEEWAIPDPKDLPADEYRAVRDLIERRVKELLASL